MAPLVDAVSALAVVPEKISLNALASDFVAVLSIKDTLEAQPCCEGMDMDGETQGSSG